MGRSPPNAPQDDQTPHVTPEVAAEAAVWVARLHGPSRSPKMEREFRAWQARSAAHRHAFERTTDMWEAVPRVSLADAYASANANASASASSRAPGVNAGGGGGGYDWRGRRLHLVPALVVPLLAAAAFLFFRTSVQGDAYATKVGEQQLIVLDDGSRMTLNTDTKVRVKMRTDRRAVEVEEGEALFEVAKDSQRPFIVRVGGTEVEAVGTVFSVRLADGGDHFAAKLAVTLVEGQVKVRADPSSWTGGLAPGNPVLMHAGERIQLAKIGPGDGGALQQLDRPRMDRVLAWKRNEAVFDDVRLSDAIAEMNRYSRTPITLRGDAALAQLRVSGQFKTGDNASFAQAISALHGLTLRKSGGKGGGEERLELSLPH